MGLENLSRQEAPFIQGVAESLANVCLKFLPRKIFESSLEEFILTFNCAVRRQVGFRGQSSSSASPSPLPTALPNVSPQFCCCRLMCSCACHNQRGPGRPPKFTDSAHLVRRQRVYDVKFSKEFFTAVQGMLATHEELSLSTGNVFLKLCNLIPSWMSHFVNTFIF